MGGEDLVYGVGELVGEYVIDFVIDFVVDVDEGGVLQVDFGGVFFEVDLFDFEQVLVVLGQVFYVVFEYCYVFQVVIFGFFFVLVLGGFVVGFVEDFGVGVGVQYFFDVYVVVDEEMLWYVEYWQGVGGLDVGFVVDFDGQLGGMFGYGVSFDFFDFFFFFRERGGEREDGCDVMFFFGGRGDELGVGWELFVLDVVQDFYLVFVYYFVYYVFGYVVFEQGFGEVGEFVDGVDVQWVDDFVEVGQVLGVVFVVGQLFEEVVVVVLGEIGVDVDGVFVDDVYYVFDGFGVVVDG